MPLYENFFEITLTLCERFPDFNPIKLRKYPLHEVFLLIKRLSNHNRKQVQTGKIPNKQGVIRRPAGDNWF